MTITMTIGSNNFAFSGEPTFVEAGGLALQWLAALGGLDPETQAAISAARDQLKAEAAKLQASINNQS